MYAAIAAGVGCLGVVWWEESKSPQPGGLTAFSMLGVMLAALFKVWVALSACVRFVDDRRSGAMELLLCTPMRPEEIIRGQWLALRRQFAGPAVVVLLLATGVLALRLTSNLATSGLTAWGSVLSHGCWMLVFVADVVALAWLGMWFGLTSRHTYGAAGKALLCIQVAPWVAYYLAMAGIMALFAAVTRAGGGTFSATFPGFSHPEPPHSLRAVCKSLWQTPQYKISICTSCGSISLLLIVNGANDAVAFCAAYDFVEAIIILFLSFNKYKL